MRERESERERKERAPCPPKKNKRAGRKKVRTESLVSFLSCSGAAHALPPCVSRPSLVFHHGQTGRLQAHGREQLAPAEAGLPDRGQRGELRIGKRRARLTTPPSPSLPPVPPGRPAGRTPGTGLGWRAGRPALTTISLPHSQALFTALRLFRSPRPTRTIHFTSGAFAALTSTACWAALRLHAAPTYLNGALEDGGADLGFPGGFLSSLHDGIYIACGALLLSTFAHDAGLALLGAFPAYGVAKVWTGVVAPLLGGGGGGGGAAARAAAPAVDAARARAAAEKKERKAARRGGGGGGRR